MSPTTSLAANRSIGERPSLRINYAFANLVEVEGDPLKISVTLLGIEQNVQAVIMAAWDPAGGLEEPEFFRVALRALPVGEETRKRLFDYVDWRYEYLRDEAAKASAALDLDSAKED